MHSKRLTPEQVALKELILKKTFSEFGSIEEIKPETGDIFSSGHPICSPAVGWCAPGNYMSGPSASCGGYTTYTWCAS